MFYRKLNKSTSILITIIFLFSNTLYGAPSPRYFSKLRVPLRFGLSNADQEESKPPAAAIYSGKPEYGKTVVYEIGKAEIDESGQFARVFIPADDNIGVVIKVPKNEEAKEILLNTYNDAKAALGKRGARTTLVRDATFIINGKEQFFKIALVQEKVTKLKDLNITKETLDEVFQLEREMYALGRHNQDHKILEGYGRAVDGSIKLFDFTSLSGDRDTFYAKLTEYEMNMLLYNTAELRTRSDELADYLISKEISVDEFDFLWSSDEDAREEIADVDIENLPRKKLASNSSFTNWDDLEKKELAGKVFDQQRRNLSVPQRVAFNVDSFAADEDVVLYSGLNRIFDSIFRLLDGNPNFIPQAIFLDNYAKGMPSSKERLAEFLNSNPAFGNSKYKVKLQDNNLIINGQKISIYDGLAKPEQLKKLGVNFLVEATRQRYLNIRDEAKRAEAKVKEEKTLKDRLDKYYDADKDGIMRVVVITPEEDRFVDSSFLYQGLVVFKIGSESPVAKSPIRQTVLAEPVTTVSSIICDTVNRAIQKENPKAKISVIKVETIRSDRQGNRLINLPAIKPALALNKIVLGENKLNLTGLVSDTGAISGANAIKVILHISGYVEDLTPATINEAFRNAAKGELKGVIDFRGESTTSGFEKFNQHPVVFLPIKADDLKNVSPLDGPPYKTVVLTGFYSEYGYAKSVLDLMTALSIFDGNKAKPGEVVSLETPKGTIPPSPEILRKQVVADGEPIPVVINSARGRMAVGLYPRLWRDPNFKIVAINGVRSSGKDITAQLIQYDEVFGEAPFTVQVTSDGKHFKFTDREERVTLLNRKTLDKDIELLPTTYGNLLIRQDKEKILEMRLHGELITKINIEDNKDGTFTVQGKLRNGTTIKLTYSREKSKFFTKLISVGIRKQEIIPFANIRADKSAYKQKKGEKPEVFSARVQNYNRKLARKILVELPQLNENVLFLEGSGQLTEAAKLQPFYLAGAGKGLISAPAKGTISGVLATDTTIIPGVNTEGFLSVWDILQTASCASCTTNAAAVGAKALLNLLFVISGYFDTIHAITNTQGRQFSEILKNITRSVDSRNNIVWETSGASTELGKVLAELLNTISGASLRVANDDGSLVNYDFQVMPREGKEIPGAEEINTKIKELTELPEKDGGLKGFLGYGTYKTSLGILGSDLGGIFDSSMTRVNDKTGTVSVGLWYDNERGYLNQYIILALLVGLHSREVGKGVEVVAQNVVGGSGAYTGRVKVSTAIENGANSVIVGSGQFRTFEKEANEYRVKKIDVNSEINKALKEAIASNVNFPILNIHISDVDRRRGGGQDTINRQISECLKDIPAEDIMRIMFSFEIENEKDLSADEIGEYLGMIRNAVSGNVARSYLTQMEDEKEAYTKEFGTAGYEAYINELKGMAKGSTELETLQNYARLLGANVAQKIRVVARLNAVSGFKGRIDILMNKSDCDGFIFSNSFVLDSLREIAGNIDRELTVNSSKRDELNKRYSPRFFICSSLGSTTMGIIPNTLPDYIDALSRVNYHNIQIAIAPPVTQLAELSSVLKGEESHVRATLASKVPVNVLLQNATLEKDKEGFVTLEDAVRNLGVHDVLFAHSEIIDLTGITNQEVSKLAKASHELKRKEILTGNVVVAVGETLADYEAGNSGKIVKEHVLGRLAGLSDEEVADTVIAYEPRWAIGTGITPKNTEIQKMHELIRNTIKDEYGLKASQKVRIVYGGSLDLQNAEEILRLRDVDGALIGSASTSAENFGKIVSIAEGLFDTKNAARPFPRRCYIAGNHKALNVKDSYPKFVNILMDVDRRKVEVAIGPELSNIHKLVDVYAKDPLKDIVFIDQLTKEEIAGKTFFVRVDFNLPILDIKAKPNDPDTWQITSDARLRAALPTINHIRENGGIAVLVSHFEPKGVNVKGPQSTRFLVPRIEEILCTKVTFVGDIFGPARHNTLKRARPGDVIFFENVRLDKDIAKSEKASTNSPADITARDNLASKLYAGQSKGNPTANVVIVSDGFGVMHRNQGSVTGQVKGVPRIGGILLGKELKFGVEAIRGAKHPVAIVIGGGAKLTDKVPLFKNIILNTLVEGDKIFIYGAAALPFLMARDSSFEPGKGRSLFDEKTVQAAREVIELAEEEDIEIVAAVDFVAADSLPSDESQTVTTDIVFRDKMTAAKGAYDIGPKTVARFREEILDEDGKSRFGMIIANGPAGAFEYEEFRVGTRGIFDVIVEATKTEQNQDGAVTILGGADTLYAAELLGVVDKVSHVSTGGGAFLELLEGKDLPGVEVLRNNAGELAHHLNENIEKGFNRIRATVSDYAEASVEKPEKSISSIATLKEKGTGRSTLTSL